MYVLTRKSPHRAGLILCQIPHCTELNVSQMPGGMMEMDSFGIDWYINFELRCCCSQQTCPPFFLLLFFNVPLNHFLISRDISKFTKISRAPAATTDIWGVLKYHEPVLIPNTPKKTVLFHCKAKKFRTLLNWCNTCISNLAEMQLVLANHSLENCQPVV